MPSVDASRRMASCCAIAPAESETACCKYSADYGSDLLVLPIDDAAERYENGFKTARWKRSPRSVGGTRWRSSRRSCGATAVEARGSP